ncbi:MAG: hypothetical protein ACLFQJ_07110 [Campylobacterales bacterium]
MKDKKINTPQTTEEFKKRVTFKNGEKSINSIKIEPISKSEVKINTPQTTEEFNRRISF